MAEMAVQLIHDNAPAGVESTKQLWLGLEDFLASYRIRSERLRKQVDAGATGDVVRQNSTGRD
jgi:hypothetical protein